VSWRSSRIGGAFQPGSAWEKEEPDGEHKDECTSEAGQEHARLHSEETAEENERDDDDQDDKSETEAFAKEKREPLDLRTDLKGPGPSLERCPMSLGLPPSLPFGCWRTMHRKDRIIPPFYVGHLHHPLVVSPTGDTYG
jgi:hypothetical protein